MSAEPHGSKGLPPGSVVVVAGPDGSGKTSVAGEIAAAGGDGAHVLWLHARPRLLPSRHGGIGEPVTDPYGRAPYPTAISVAKVVYYWLDFVVGWLLRVRPVLRAGGAVVLERGWWDLAADPRRYRLGGAESAVRVLGRLVPRPTATFVLTGPAELLLERTGDNLDAGDLGAQLDGLRSVFSGDGRAIFLDVRKPVGELRDEILSALGADVLSRMTWAGLPRPSAPRWMVPRNPRRVAAGALRIHRPMTPRAHAVWQLGSAAASFGAARLLPAAAAGAVPDLGRLARWVPPGGAVAIARSNHAQRHHALIVDRRGHPVAHAKVAGDERGRIALSTEADNLTRYGALLVQPLRAPRLVHRDDGLLLTEAVVWRPTTTPWRLDPIVANRLGAWFALAKDSDDRGPAHGDFAPWNLLPTADAWVLVDWEMATGDAPAFFDVIHWFVMGAAHLRRPRLQVVTAGLDGLGWAGACFQAYADGARISVGTLRRDLLTYLELTAERVDTATREGAREQPVRRRMRAECVD